MLATTPRIARLYLRPKYNIPLFYSSKLIFLRTNQRSVILLAKFTYAEWVVGTDEIKRSVDNYNVFFKISNTVAV